MFSGIADGKFPSKFLRLGALIILLPEAKIGFMVQTKIRTRKRDMMKTKWSEMSVLNEAEGTMNQHVIWGHYTLQTKQILVVNGSSSVQLITDVC